MNIDTDYLVIGSGASGLAFADSLLTETTDARITIVDRQGKPGGHWNDAYPFVTLHQPSAYYGVNSMELGSGLVDTIGLNKGLYELASGASVCGYFDNVMNQRLLPSGRVSYHPMCNYFEDSNEFESLLSGQRTKVTVRKKVVDATYFSPDVPSTRKPKFKIDEGVQLVPPNALPSLWHRSQGRTPPKQFVVLGAGKTGMDACVWLLQSGAPAESIQWVVPRDSWVINRATTQSGAEFFESAIGGQAGQFEAFAKATSIEDLYLRLEASGRTLRIDATRMPEMFHFAILSEPEVQVLRQIRNVIRLGRVQALHADRMVLDQGNVPVAPDTLFVDCTTTGIVERPAQPIFQGNKIVPQLVRVPLISFSAAVIAYVEAHYDDEAHKNRLCAAVPFTHQLRDFPKTMLVSMTNQFHWTQDKRLRDWMRSSRLDSFGKLVSSASKEDATKQALLAQMRDQSVAAMANIPKLIAMAG